MSTQLLFKFAMLFAIMFATDAAAQGQDLQLFSSKQFGLNKLLGEKKNQAPDAPTTFEFAGRHSYYSPGAAGAPVQDPDGRTAVGIGIPSSPARIVLLSNDFNFPIAADTKERELSLKLPSGETSPSVAATVPMNGNFLVIGTAYINNVRQARIWEAVEDGRILALPFSNTVEHTEGRAVTTIPASKAFGQPSYAALIQHQRLDLGDGIEGSYPRVTRGWSKLFKFDANTYLNEGYGLLYDPQDESLLIIGQANGKPAVGKIVAATADPVNSWVLDDQPGEIRAIARTTDGYILVGWSMPTGKEVRDLFVLRVDREMSAIWARLCGGRSDDIGTSVALLSNGHILVGGGTRSSRSDGGDHGGTMNADHDPWIVELDQEGWVLGEAIVPASSGVGNVIGIIPTSKNSATINTTEGTIKEFKTTQDPGILTLKWNGKNTWTGDPIKAEFGKPQGLFVRSQPALTCLDPVSAKNGSINFLGPDAIDLQNAVKDRRR